MRSQHSFLSKLLIAAFGDKQSDKQEQAPEETPQTRKEPTLSYIELRDLINAVIFKPEYDLMESHQQLIGPNVHCFKCGAVFEKTPQKKTKCKKCGAYIYKTHQLLVDETYLELQEEIDRRTFNYDVFEHSQDVTTDDVYKAFKAFKIEAEYRYGGKNVQYEPWKWYQALEFYCMTHCKRLSTMRIFMSQFVFVYIGFEEYYQAIVKIVNILAMIENEYQKNLKKAEEEHDSIYEDVAHTVLKEAEQYYLASNYLYIKGTIGEQKAKEYFEKALQEEDRINDDSEVIHVFFNYIFKLQQSQAYSR